MMAHAEKRSDFPAAAVGFFGGAILVGVWLFAISKWTTSRFESHEAAPAAAGAEHK
jgi:hypothetical protein